MLPSLHPLVAIVGPTGAGKSSLALSLAEAFGGEIVNCDSVQVYRGLDIGSAKLPVLDRRNIPHHLIDVVEVGEDLTGGAYAVLARHVLHQIRQRDAVPLVVGGTGFYLRALLDGLSPAPAGNKQLRERLSRLAAGRPDGLYRLLRRRDPVAASRIHPNDRQKLVRAVELTLLAGKPASETQSLPRQQLEGFAVLKIGIDPDRILLHQRINDRARSMFQRGLVQETEKLLNAGAKPFGKALQTLGYKQAVQVIVSGMPVEEAISECQTRTRQYAKRQMTWFRADTEVHWLRGFGADPDIQVAAARLATEFLSQHNQRRNA